MKHIMITDFITNLVFTNQISKKLTSFKINSTCTLKLKLNSRGSIPKFSEFDRSVYNAVLSFAYNKKSQFSIFNLCQNLLCSKNTSSGVSQAIREKVEASMDKFKFLRLYIDYSEADDKFKSIIDEIKEMVLDDNENVNNVRIETVDALFLPCNTVTYINLCNHKKISGYELLNNNILFNFAFRNKEFLFLNDDNISLADINEFKRVSVRLLTLRDILYRRLKCNYKNNYVNIENLCDSLDVNPNNKNRFDVIQQTEILLKYFKKKKLLKSYQKITDDFSKTVTHFLINKR